MMNQKYLWIGGGVLFAAVGAYFIYSYTKSPAVAQIEVKPKTKK